MEEAVVVSSGRVSDSSSVHKIRSIAGGRKVLLNVVPDVGCISFIEVWFCISESFASPDTEVNSADWAYLSPSVVHHPDKQAHTHKSAKGVAPIKLKYPLKDMLVSLWIVVLGCLYVPSHQFCWLNSTHFLCCCSLLFFLLAPLASP
ncbi:hypothetical protein Q3G72_032222 [Acer saccharum]|nr:hypothetical protein Q3G72_032222 [Acer saccharum]